MRYRAVAVGDELASAVGAVELECTPHGLFVAYVGVGRVQPNDHAPADLTSGTGMTLPWSSVYEARVEHGHAFLAVDPQLVPFPRLLLTDFALGGAPPVAELGRRRWIVRVTAAAGALAGALILAATLLRVSPSTSAAGAIGVAALGAVALLGVGWILDQRLAFAADGGAALTSFSMELLHYLPGLARVPSAPAPPRQRVPDVSVFQGMLPKTSLAVVITITACVLSILLVARWVTTNRGAVARVAGSVLSPGPEEEDVPVAPPPRVARAPATPPPAPVASAAAPKASSSGPPLGAECRCRHADAQLWAEPIPRLSLLVLSERTRQGRGPDERHSKRYLELELAIVNNSDETLGEIAMMVLFYERDPPPSDKRTQVDNRPLFFEGPLLPGQAIKWSLEAEGTEFDVENPVPGSIGANGEDAAPTNRLAELLEARNRPVRLHGAMMLAFLGDPRAREGALALREALREDESPYLTRLLQALAEVRVCDLRISGSGARSRVGACLENTTAEPQPDLGMKLRGLEHPLDPSRPLGAPPPVLYESTFRVPGELPARSGRRVSFDLGTVEGRPEAWEALADRYDLVR